LISSGHKFSEIKEYTLYQFQHFVGAVMRDKKRGMMENLIINTVASRGDEKQLKDMQRSLEVKSDKLQMKQHVPSKYISKDPIRIPLGKDENNG